MTIIKTELKKQTGFFTSNGNFFINENEALIEQAKEDLYKNLEILFKDYSDLHSNQIDNAIECIMNNKDLFKQILEQK